MKNIFYHSDEYILKAHEYMDEWNYLEAKKVLTELLEEQPDHGPAHFLMGRIFSNQLADPGTAIYHYKHAIKYCPQLLEAYYNLIWVLIDRSQYERALEVCHKALDQPGIAEDWIWYFQATALEKSGSLESASEFYRRAWLCSVQEETIRSCKEGIDRVNGKLELQNRVVASYWCSQGQWT